MSIFFWLTLHANVRANIGVPPNVSSFVDDFSPDSSPRNVIQHPARDDLSHHFLLPAARWWQVPAPHVPPRPSVQVEPCNAKLLELGAQFLRSLHHHEVEPVLRAERFVRELLGRPSAVVPGVVESSSRQQPRNCVASRVFPPLSNILFRF